MKNFKLEIIVIIFKYLIKIFYLLYGYDILIPSFELSAPPIFPLPPAAPPPLPWPFTNSVMYELFVSLMSNLFIDMCCYVIGCFLGELIWDFIIKDDSSGRVFEVKDVWIDDKEIINLLTEQQLTIGFLKIFSRDKLYIIVIRFVKIFSKIIFLYFIIFYILLFFNILNPNIILLIQYVVQYVCAIN